jgi:glycosyltransferase involved in cell wall biosynthesis
MDKPPHSQISLSIFIPFYNEEKNIAAVVDEAVSTLKNHPRISQFEVIMVNDGSVDKTKELGEMLEQKYPEARLVSHEKNRGYGGAVITGIQSSRFEYLFLMDGDRQFKVQDIDTLLEYVPEHRVVAGYRAKRQDILQRRINGALWNGLIRIVFGLSVKDIDCAYKIFKREVVKDLPLVSNGAMISTELLVRLKKKGVVVKQVPVPHYPRIEGKPTGGGLGVIVKAFRELFKLYKIVS